MIGSEVSNLGAYASWWMQQAVGYSIANHGRTIRLPAYILNEIRKVNRVEADLHQQANREPSREEIAEASGTYRKPTLAIRPNNC